MKPSLFKLTPHRAFLTTLVTMSFLAACSEPTVIEPVQRRAVVRPASQDAMTGLIKHKQPYHQPQTAPIKPFYNIEELTVRNASFEYWLTTHPYQKQEVLNYQNYLRANLRQVPPIDQLVVSARDAINCGYEPYEVPPRELWPNILPTLQLYEGLKQQGYLPRSSIIRSVYRNPSLNVCAGGAAESKHMTNGAIDVWIPENEGDKWATEQTLSGLCQFWQTQGSGYNVGLGLYPSGAIHLDTQGYRKWGSNHSASSSPCGF